VYTVTAVSERCPASRRKPRIVLVPAGSGANSVKTVNNVKHINGVKRRRSYGYPTP